MAERIQKQVEKKVDEAVEVDTQKVGEVAAKGTVLKAEIDDLLDEIDTVLEPNAAEFVENYIQKGGE